ncbi:efflux RND transporter periplasmic adaptor subunit [Rhizobiaceae bacterium BDR2-2]|uniref:Efflux RND transporter periplasmic adaptor subunit n=1 Tax=Ectorhizobium quercum TaxID=2965071 RepID=A0AAE3SVR4_9HYPH|nr:efflux RND transporter periplasmic adaptor subunit [Ectorhizobium quercum]MCX8997943.1 efflux RND transporter periplasmic adaptor subunit [Ectorhizobium quercum]
MRLVKQIGLLAALSALAACSAEQAPGTAASEKVEVGYIVVQPEAVPQTLDLRGRVVPLATAEVRPQVNGIVRRIAFAEGREVAAGDVLYEIDDAKFRAAYAAANAALSKASAATASAQTTYDRNKALAQTNAVSEQALEDAQSSLLQAQASEEAAKADLETARINLDNATIRAPIGGMIGVSTVSVGALVTENQTDALATIRQIDPIHVDLVDTSANLLRVRDEIDAGRLSRDRGTPTTVALTLENGKPYGEKGEVSLADMVIGETTGTFIVRATFPNTQRVLVPGMFVSASIDLGTLSDAFLIPQRAVTRGDDGKATVYVVSADDKAEQREIVTEGTSANDWIVTDGVKEGDRLIVDGFQKISDGTDVTPVEATIDDNGVVGQELAPQTGTEAGQ